MSIIDLDHRSNQPFQIADKTIILNAELYNYLELKHKLSSEGVVFKTQSDTEVLIAALHHWGPNALELCEGMWAFALYDETKGTLLLSRDRFGEKPLYLYQDQTGIYFASEVKFLFALLGKNLPIHYPTLYRYLILGYKSVYKNAEGFFKGVSELPSSTMLTIHEDGSQKSKKYWSPRFQPEDSMSFSQAAEQARERLIHSVKLRLRSDVPLAFCMSGGIDSNALISIAKKELHYDVHGFTIETSDERYDETDLVAQSVKELGIRHTGIKLSTDHFLENLRKLVRYHDAPVYTITYYVHWLLMQAVASHGYKISISGTAADELFAGYYDHHLAYLYEMRDRGAAFEQAEEAWIKNIRPIVRNPFLQNPRYFFDNPGRREHIYLNADEFKKALLRPWTEVFHEEPFCEDLLRNRMMNELFFETTPVILHEDDLNAMYFSIENRSPFLDKDLFELCFRIPTRHLIQDGYNKAVLREAMKGIIPDPILQTRKKIGFNAPIHSLLQRNDRSVNEELFDDSPIFDHLDRSKIKTLLEKETLPNSESKFLFYFLSAKMFVEEFS